MDIVLTDGNLKLILSEPGEYYQGTRFDWSGVFKRIEYCGRIYADKWFDGDDPRTHDHVCGTSEEFLPPIGYDEAIPGGSFLKLGVGRLVKDTDLPYDWFRTYPIADQGRRTLETEPGKAVFTHILDGCYEYVKTVGITGPGRFRISHELKNTSPGPLSVEQYNHNFFTFGLDRVGPGRSLEFACPIQGDWRPDSVNAAKDDRSIRITAPMQPGQKAYIGNIQTLIPTSSTGYSFKLRCENGLEVHTCSDRAMSHSVFWTNHRVFCPEPYISLDILPSQTGYWCVDYRLGWIGGKDGPEAVRQSQMVPESGYPQGLLSREPDF